MKTKNGLWKLSPSGLYSYTECKACFWLENHHRKPPMLPLALNTAMDSILKTRYDKYRADKKFPPESKELEKMGIRTFDDLELLNEWRTNSSALKVVNENSGYELVGKIDDVFVESDGRFIPADYKSSGNAPAEDKQKYYRDQLAAYGYMFLKNGYKPSDRAFLLHYFVKDKNDPSTEVKFASHVDEVKIDAKNFEKKLKEMVDFLEKPYPGDDLECKKCDYYAGRNEKKIRIK
ncbi:MAG: PD-(D/E)XK nuclease family protein [Candidatus Niyogibacteria bacterium]|nr:MAG: PD-(D/E)XK nuclease family protein [Candidatus Niyogibacteria bacterium]